MWRPRSRVDRNGRGSAAARGRRDREGGERHSLVSLRPLRLVDSAAAADQVVRCTTSPVGAPAHSSACATLTDTVSPLCHSRRSAAGGAMITGLVNRGPLITTLEKFRAGDKMIEVVKVRITAAGRGVLAAEG